MEKLELTASENLQTKTPAEEAHQGLLHEAMEWAGNHKAAVAVAAAGAILEVGMGVAMLNRLSQNAENIALKAESNILPTELYMDRDGIEIFKKDLDKYTGSKAYNLNTYTLDDTKLISSGIPIQDNRVLISSGIPIQDNSVLISSGIPIQDNRVLISSGIPIQDNRVLISSGIPIQDDGVLISSGIPIRRDADLLSMKIRQLPDMDLRRFFTETPSPVSISQGGETSEAMASAFKKAALPGANISKGFER